MKLKQLIYSKKLAQIIGVFMLTCFLAYGVVGQVSARKIMPTTAGSQQVGTWQYAGLVRSKANLSQTKVLQGSDGQVYVQIGIEALDDVSHIKSKMRTPTDFVVVLDRSGSMESSGKIDYARQAIVSLLKQLDASDRFALVTFDSIVETPIGMTTVTSENLTTLITKVQSISTRGSTDLGSGLEQGIHVLKNAVGKKNQAKRIILVSDGQANVGITDTVSLSQIAAKAVPGEFVVSSIGVGLDFNETLLASLADYGTGSYYFLENPSKMETVIAKEFYGASDVFAKNLKIQFNLASGIQVVDVSGYPVVNQGMSKIVKPGHLYRKQTKTIFATLKVPTNNLYSEALGNVILSYEIEGKMHAVKLIDNDVTIACLPIEKKKDVIASIDKDTFGEAWASNNYGQFMKDSASYIREGKYEEAKGNIKKFKEKLSGAYAAAPSKAIADQMQELDEFEGDMETELKAGSMSGADQKRLSKQLHYEGGMKQRKK
ncbi:MAG: VWA domain-containing protein [bacterium]|nr:VWA domain-containing protein [bacterium]MBU1917023.1 VWA domain-containing protein [bacterium]